MTKKTNAQAVTIPETAITMIEFGRLVRAPENVRHTDADNGIDELADDIAGHGLLQSLIGYADDDDTATTTAGPLVYVVGGGRRFAALGVLADRGAVSATYLVPVTLRPREEAVELSLAENLGRRDMNPADEFVAFETLLRPGIMSPADLAKRFGFTERYVKQRLRLAQLVPEVLQALRDRTITLDAATAYACTQDRDLQLSTFKAHSRKGAWDAHNPEKIRRDIANKGMQDDDQRFRFIGPKAYERAGGGYDDDLFLKASDKRWLNDPALVDQLARDHIDFQMVEKLSELQQESPSVCGYLVVPPLKIFSWGPNDWGSPPDGFEFVEKYEADKIWSVIRNNNIPAHVVVGIDVEGKLAVWMKRVAVPKDQVRAIMGDAPQHRGYTPPTPEEREASAREEFVALEAGRLAVPKFAGTPLEGRAFWPRDRWNGIEATTLPGLGEGYLVSLKVFVTKEAYAAQADAANLAYDEHKAEVARREAEKEARGAEAEAAKAARVQELIDNPPAIVLDVSESVVYFRWASGAYMDVLEGSPEAQAGEGQQGFDSLGELLDYVDVDDARTFATGEELAGFARPGVCRVCGCDYEHACALEDGPCEWVDDGETLCSKPTCIAAAAAPETQPELENA